MSQLQRLREILWAYKWWWSIPLVGLGLVFLLLVVFRDQTGLAPFLYVVN